MGWCESPPPIFCSISETAGDIIQTLLEEDLPVHIFEEIMLCSCTPSQTFFHPWPLTLFAVCVDNFIAKSNRLTLHDLCHISRAMLYGIHLIFQPKSITRHCGHDPVSEKTLEKGEDTWEYLKEILVWLFDGEDFTIQLPKDKFDSIFRLLCCIMKLPKVSVR